MKKLPLLFEDQPAELTPPARGPLARGIAAAVAIYLATRLVVFIATYSGAIVCLRIEHKIEPPLEYRVPKLAMELSNPDSPVSRRYRELVCDGSPMLHWDAGHYRSIIDHGYEYEPAKVGVPQDENQHNIAFFPLYPMVCAVFAPLIGTPAAMILVANACGLGAAVLLFLWVRRRIDDPTALFAVACVFCWPAAGFYSYGYTESTTLLLFTAALLLLDGNRFVPAAVVSALATAARPTALPMAALVSLVYLIRRKLPLPRRFGVAVLLGVIGVTGISLYAIYLTYRFGSPMVYTANFRDGWVPDRLRPDWAHFLTFGPLLRPLRLLGHAFRDMPASLTQLVSPMSWNMPCGFMVLFLSIAGMPRVPRSFRPLLLLGPLVFLQVYVSSAGNEFSLSAVSRYTMVAAPAFVVLAAWSMREWRPWMRTVMISGFLLLQAVWAFQFGMHEWTG